MFNFIFFFSCIWEKNKKLAYDDYILGRSLFKNLTCEIKFYENEKYVSANGWCIIKGEDNSFFDIRLLLINDDMDAYAIKTDYVQVYNLSLVMNDGHDYENGGFRTRIKKIV